MAVTAKFLADFSSFTTQVDKAVVTARKFETSIDKVETSLDRMADSFSGRRIIEQATLAERAIHEIGGVSKLTKDELERLGNMAAQATAKMRAIGEAVPKRLEELATHAKASTKELGLMDSVIGRIGPQLAAAFSVGAVINFAKEIGNFAGRMVDLSAETGIGTTRLQALDYAAAGAGLTVEDITSSVTQMSKRIATGNDSTVAAFDRLGLSIYQIQQQNPSDAFIAIGEAIAKIENPMERTKVAMELFGKSGARMLRLMTEDMGKMIEEIERTGPIINENLIKKADEFDDAWTLALKHVKAGIVTTAGVFASAFTVPAPNLQGGRAGVTLGSGFQDAKVGGAPAFTNQAIIDAQNAAAVAAMTKGMKGPASPFGPGAAPPLPDAAKLKAMVDQWNAQEKAQQKAASGAAALANEVQRLAKEYEKWIIVSKNAAGEAEIAKLAAGFSDIQSAVDAGLLSIQGFVPQLAAVGAVGGTATDELERMAIALYALPPALESVADSAGVSGGDEGGIFGRMGKGVKGLLEKFTGGKGLSGLLGTIGTGFLEGIGNMISGGLSSLIGGGLNLAIKGIGKLFGGGEHSKVNDMRDAYIESAGGIAKLAEEAQKAGTSVDRLLSAKKIADFESAVKSLDTQLETFAENQEEAEQAAADHLQAQIDAVSRYGIALADVAPAIRDKVLGDQAEGLLDDWQALMDAGVAVTTVQDKMRESIMAYIDTALQAGSEIPDAFRPMLEAILLTGDYADAAALSLMNMGELAAAALRIATGEARRLNAELARNTYGADNDSPTQGGSVDFEPKMFDPKTGSWITPTLASWQGAGNQGGTEAQFRSAFNLDVIGAARSAGFSEEYVNNWARSNGGDISRFGRAHNLPGFWGGTGGRYLNFGAGMPAMLHGRERVSTEAEGRAEMAGLGALAGSIDAMRRDFSTFPELMRDALQTRVVVAH